MLSSWDDSHHGCVPLQSCGDLQAVTQALFCGLAIVAMAVNHCRVNFQRSFTLKYWVKVHVGMALLNSVSSHLSLRLFIFPILLVGRSSWKMPQEMMPSQLLGSVPMKIFCRQFFLVIHALPLLPCCSVVCLMGLLLLHLRVKRFKELWLVGVLCFFPAALQNVMTCGAQCLPALPGLDATGLSSSWVNFSMFCSSSLLLTQEQGSFVALTQSGWETGPGKSASH